MGLEKAIEILAVAMLVVYAVLRIAAIVILITVFFRVTVWLYRKMCKSRKKRLDRMMEKYIEDQERGDGNEKF